MQKTSTKRGGGIELYRSSGISINLKRFCQVKMYMANPIATAKKVTLKIEKIIKGIMMLYQKVFTYYKRKYYTRNKGIQKHISCVENKK